MPTSQGTHVVIDDIFEETAHLLADLFEEFDAQHELIEKCFRSLLMVRERAVQQLAVPTSQIDPNATNAERRTSPHAAAEEFLVQIGRW